MLSIIITQPIVIRQIKKPLRCGGRGKSENPQGLDDDILYCSASAQPSDKAYADTVGHKIGSGVNMAQKSQVERQVLRLNP